MKKNNKKNASVVSKIKVLGIGGAGGSVVNRMAKAPIFGVDYIALNTDQQALSTIRNSVQKIIIGKTITKGWGTGMNPEIGRAAVEENIAEVREALKGADIIFITAGLGGGTGTGAAPIVADLAKELKSLVIGVVTKPFSFEGAARQSIAEEGLRKLSNRVDALAAISNNRILEVIDKSTPLLKAFSMADEILNQGVTAITDTLNKPGLINIDFANIKMILEGAGPAILNSASASGEGRANQIIKSVLDNSLFELPIDGAKNVLLAISGSSNLKMNEVNEIAQAITHQIDKQARVIFGATINEFLEDEIRVTLVATGFNKINPPMQIKKIETSPLEDQFTPLEILKEKRLSKDNLSLTGFTGLNKTAAEEVNNKAVIIEEQSPQGDEYEIPAFLRRKISK